MNPGRLFINWVEKKLTSLGLHLAVSALSVCVVPKGEDLAIRGEQEAVLCNRSQILTCNL